MTTEVKARRQLPTILPLNLKYSLTTFKGLWWVQGHTLDGAKVYDGPQRIKRKEAILAHNEWQCAPVEVKLTVRMAKEICRDFAKQHKITFVEAGEVGFGRECVGFRHKDNYIDYNPMRGEGFSRIEELACPAAHPPKETPDAYHKHDCLAVLGLGNSAIIQLAYWVLSMQSKGTVEIVKYENGSTGLQALIDGGTVGHAVIVRDPATGLIK